MLEIATKKVFLYTRKGFFVAQNMVQFIYE